MKNTENAEQKYGQAGYPNVEKLVDTENFDEINGAFEMAYSELDEIAHKKKGFKTQKDVKRAMRSLELTLELFRELLTIKYRLQEEFKKSSDKG